MHHSNREMAGSAAIALFQFAVSDVCVLILYIVNIRGLLTIFKEDARSGFLRLADTGRS
jgi:hypothetical protein